MKLKPINKCNTVAELLADKSRWTKGATARDAHGLQIHSMDLNATCFCVYGAMRRINGGEPDYVSLARLEEAIGSSGVAEFNDTHTYEEVYAKVLEAGI